ACFPVQRLGARAPEAPIDASPWGGYLNYDIAVDWRDREAAALGALLDVNLFGPLGRGEDRKSTRLNSSHVKNSYAVFCLKQKQKSNGRHREQVHKLRGVTNQRYHTPYLVPPSEYSTQYAQFLALIIRQTPVSTRTRDG